MIDYLFFLLKKIPEIVIKYLLDEPLDGRNATGTPHDLDTVDVLQRQFAVGQAGRQRVLHAGEQRRCHLFKVGPGQKTLLKIEIRNCNDIEN